MAARARGLAAAYATNVVQTRLGTRPGACNLHYDARQPFVARPSSPSRAANYFGSNAAAGLGQPPPLVHAVHVSRAPREGNRPDVHTQRRTSGFGCAAQLLQEADSGPFAAPGAEAPLFSLDERRHAACRSLPPNGSLVAATGMPRGAARALGLAAAYATNVRRTNHNSRHGVLSMKLRVTARPARVRHAGTSAPNAFPRPTSGAQLLSDSVVVAGCRASHATLHSP